MFRIAENNIITLERGDYGSFQIKINIGTTRAPNYYTLDEDDNIFLGVMEPNQPFEHALIKKVYKNTDIVDGVLTIEIVPSDTIRLLPGTYYYEIKLRCLESDQYIIENGVMPSKVYTILPKTKFIIWE